MKKYSNGQHVIWWLGGLVAVLLLVTVTAIMLNKPKAGSQVSGAEASQSFEIADKRISDLSVAEDTTEVTESADEQDQAMEANETLEPVDTNNEANQILVEDTTGDPTEDQPSA